MKGIITSLTSGNKSAAERQEPLFYPEPKPEFEWPVASDQKPAQQPATSGGQDNIEETTATTPRVRSKLAEDMV